MHTQARAATVGGVTKAIVILLLIWIAGVACISLSGSSDDDGSIAESGPTSVVEQEPPAVSVERSTPPADPKPQTEARQETSYAFKVKRTKIGPKGLHMRLDTDLPDNAHVRVTVTRVYTATSDGRTDKYSQEYFSEDGEVSQWREIRIVPLDADDWITRLLDHQSDMAKLSREMAFEIEEIDTEIEISAWAFANTSGARFGRREWPDVNARLRGTESVASDELVTRFDLLGAERVPRKSSSVGWDSLEYGLSYKLLGPQTPLMEGAGAQSVDDLVHFLMPAGTVVRVEAVTRVGGNFWYNVSLPGYRGQEGWINSVALIRDGALLLPVTGAPTQGEGQPYRASGSTIDYRSEIMDSVVDPCLLAIYRKMDLNLAISDSEVVDGAKRLMPPGQIDTMIENLTELVKGESLSARTVLYNASKQGCISGGI